MGYIDKIKKRMDVVRSQRPAFPFMSCTASAIDLQDAFGWVYVGGSYGGPISEEYREQLARFIRENPDNFHVREYWEGLSPAFTKVLHSFAYDPKNRNFVDMTANQFDSSLDDIVIIHREDPRVAFLERQPTEETTHFAAGFRIAQRSGGRVAGFRVDEGLLLNEGVVRAHGNY